MEPLCVYKDKLDEAVTLVSEMSPVKKKEAVEYWNHTANRLSLRIVPDNSSDKCRPQQSTGQQSSLDYQQQQASYMNPTVISGSEVIGTGLSEQVNQQRPDDNMDPNSDLSQYGTPMEQFQHQDPMLNSTLYEDYYSSNINDGIQQLSQNEINDEINSMTTACESASDTIDSSNNCALVGPVITMDNGSQLYQTSISPSMSNLATVITDNFQASYDNSTFCPVLGNSVQEASAVNSNPAAVSPGQPIGSSKQTHVTSTINIEGMHSDQILCSEQNAAIHDIGNGQFDRGPRYDSSGGQTQVSSTAPTSIMDSALTMGSCTINPSRNDSFTHGARPLQQIQIYGQRPTTGGDYHEGRVRAAFLQQNQQCSDGSGVQQRVIYIPGSALVTPPPCSSGCFDDTTRQDNLAIKLEGDVQGQGCTKANNEQHTCELCGKSGFSTKGNLKRHRKAHAGEKPYQCDHCESKFTEKKSLKIHLRRHTGEKPYKCSICEKLFSQTGVLKSHMAIHVEGRKFNCDKCDKAFRQRSQLKLHLMRHDGIKKLECSRCMAKFLTKGDLERHFRTHTGERPYSCKMCEKTFTRQQSLNEHMNRHVGRRPFQCKQCDKSFSEMSACYKHAKIHKKNEQVHQQNG